MNYNRIYSNLINRALNRNAFQLDEPTERHHIQPRSMGGKDDLGNIVFLTAREHYLAHLCLFKMGNPNQIFSVKCFLDDSINTRSHRFGLFRWKRWLRKAVALQFASNHRNAAKAELTDKFLKRMEALNKSFEAHLLSIERLYAARFLNAVLDDVEQVEG